MKSSRAAVRKGTCIVCPLCERIVGAVVRDIYWGEIIKPEHFRFVAGSPKKGDPLLCPYCGFPLGVETILGGILSTEHGWLPYGFPISALIPQIYDFLKKGGMWKKEWDRLLQKKRHKRITSHYKNMLHDSL